MGGDVRLRSGGVWLKKEVGRNPQRCSFLILENITRKRLFMVEHDSRREDIVTSADNAI
jgi:hypothetical protein